MLQTVGSSPVVAESFVVTLAEMQLKSEKVLGSSEPDTVDRTVVVRDWTTGRSAAGVDSVYYVLVQVES